MTTNRVALLWVLSVLACGSTGCYRAANRHALRQSQHRTMQLYQQNQALANQNQQSLGQLASERDQLRQQLGVMQQRLDNLQGERAQLMDKYNHLVNMTKNTPSPLSEQATNDLSELAQKYPGFEFDPRTGVSKFHSDVLFASGSSDIRPEAQPLLQEFAKIMNDGESQQLKILVVGHTDDRPVAKPATRAKHTDNWGLSTNRANEVVRNLAKNSVQDARMGSAGYGPHQPLVPNSDAESRQRNRRVEIFVLAPDADVAFNAGRKN